MTLSSSGTQASASSMQSPPSQRGGDQGHHLAASVGSAWGSAQVEVTINEFTQAHALGEGYRKKQPSIVDQAVVVKAIWKRSGFSSGSICWVLLVSGRFPLSKTIIPDAKEEFVTSSPRRDAHPSGRLGLNQSQGEMRRNMG